MSESSFWHNPTLEGRLVLLRPFTEADIESAWEMVNDPVGNDLTATTEQFEFTQIQHWYRTRNDHGDRIDLAVVERSTGLFAGEVVLNEYDPDAGSCSFRISLRGPAWYGRGLGTEATRLIVGYGIDILGLKAINLEVLARNQRARRSYEKVGFTVVNHSTEDGEQWIHMTISKLRLQESPPPA